MFTFSELKSIAAKDFQKNTAFFYLYKFSPKLLFGMIAKTTNLWLYLVNIVSNYSSNMKI